MANRDGADKFAELALAFMRGKVGRREFIIKGTQLGLSAAVLTKMSAACLGSR